MSIFAHRMDILPPAQVRLWPELQPAADLGFVLYGGTAIALRLGHRQSVDFDFFTEHPLDRVALSQAFPFLADSQVLQDQPNTYCVLAPYCDDERSHVKVSFFGGIGFGRVGEPEWTDDENLLVASLDDLMATKVKVVLQRVEAKDYHDVAAMVTAGVSLPKGLSSARQLYGNAFQPSEALKALVYFEGGDLHTVSAHERQTLIDAVSAVRDLPNVEIAAATLADHGPRNTRGNDHGFGM